MAGVAACASLALGVAAASGTAAASTAAVSAGRAGGGSSPAGVSSTGGGSRSLGRDWSVTVSPAPEDLALVAVRFPAAHREPVTDATLHASVPGPFGDDYLALAALRSRPALAFVLVVDRLSPLLDPAHVGVRLSARRALGPARLATAANPFAPTSAGAAPALCELPAAERPLREGQLLALGSRGGALSRFGAAAAVADAYDAVCGLPYPSAFKLAVTEPCAPALAPYGSLIGASCATRPTPESPSPSPGPEPPVTPTPSPPQCPPCDPQPGYVCPLALAPDVCEEKAQPAAARSAFADG